MDLEVDCSASCFFNSCNGSGTCACECSFFSCSCGSYNPKDEMIKPNASLLAYQINKDVHVEDISMNKKQYENLKEFVNFLLLINKDETNKVYKNIVNLVSALKNKDNSQFNEERKNYLQNLNNLNLETKQIVNDYFIKVGALERI